MHISPKNLMKPADIVVVGGSAGALGILQCIVRDLPDDFPAAVFVVLHVSPDAPSHLAEIVNRAGPLAAAFAKNEEKIVASRIYLAPPDQHLLVSDGIIHLTRDPLGESKSSCHRSIISLRSSKVWPSRDRRPSEWDV
jgi:two-component system, chemotaxis family, protein-glutamate methylesterase/glutaminase